VEADKAHNMQRTQCNELLPEYDSKITHHSDAATTSSQRVLDTTKLLNDAEEQLGLTLANIEELSTLLVNGQETREAEAAAFVIS